MKIKSKKNKLPIIVIAIISLLVLGGVSYAAVAFFQSKSSTSDNKEPANQSKSSTNKRTSSSSSSEASQPATKDDGSKTPVQYEGASPETNPSLTGIINYSKVVGDNLTVRVTIDQVISQGTCTLTLTHTSGKVVSKTANVFANPSSSTCQGFDVPTAELAPGQWTISIAVNSGDKTGTIEGKASI